MKKIIGAAVSIMTVLAASVSVQAAAINITEAKVKDAQTVSVTLKITDPAENTQYSVLVSKGDSQGAVKLENAVYIDQLKAGDYKELGGVVTFDIKVAALDPSVKYQLNMGATNAETAADVDYQIIGEDDITPPTDTPTPSPEGMWGDADGNSKLTANDAATALAYGSDNAIKIEFELADVNGDKTVDANDAALIIGKVLDSSKTLPVENS